MFELKFWYRYTCIISILQKDNFIYIDFDSNLSFILVEI